MVGGVSSMMGDGLRRLQEERSLRDWRNAMRLLGKASPPGYISQPARDDGAWRPEPPIQGPCTLLHLKCKAAKQQRVLALAWSSSLGCIGSQLKSSVSLPLVAPSAVNQLSDFPSKPRPAIRLILVRSPQPRPIPSRRFLQASRHVEKIRFPGTLRWSLLRLHRNQLGGRTQHGAC